MGLTVEQLPGYLRRLADDVTRKRAPAHIVTAMGLAYQREVVQSMHGPAPSAPGTPPARRSGTLARSVRLGDVSESGTSASTSVAPHTVYARIQQSGGDIYPRHMLRHGPREAGSAFSPAGLSDLGFLRFTVEGRTVFAKHVRLPPRPYMIMPPPYRQAVHDAAVRTANGLLP